jgi:hypothetical protein
VWTSDHDCSACNGRAYLRYADSWRLREDVLHPFVWGPEAYREKKSPPLRGGR